MDMTPTWLRPENRLVEVAAMAAAGTLQRRVDAMRSRMAWLMSDEVELMMAIDYFFGTPAGKAFKAVRTTRKQKAPTYAEKRATREDARREGERVLRQTRRTA